MERVPLSTATPILDGVEPMPPAHDSRSLWQFVGPSFVFASFLVASRRFGLPQHLPLPDTLVMIALVVGALRLAAIIHECGHVVAGFAGGYEFLSFNAWPIFVGHRSFGAPLRVDRAKGAPMTYMLPRNPTNRWSTIGYTLGGPLANALTTLGGIAVLARVAWPIDASPETLPGAVHAFAYWLVAISACSAIVNLIPQYRRLVPSDGAQAFDAFRGNARFVRQAALAQLQSAMRAGVRANNLDERTIERSRNPNDGSRYALYANLIAYASADERVAAGIHLEAALRSARLATAEERQMLIVEAVVYHGWHREDGERAKLWLAKLGGATQKASDRLRIEAVLLWCDGNVDGALSKVEELSTRPHLVPAWHEPAFRADMSAWIEKMHARLGRVGDRVVS